MKIKYMISRFVISGLVFLVTFILLLHDENRNIFTAVLTGASLLAGFIATPVSKRIIAYGNSIFSTRTRILFYSLLFPITLILALFSWLLMSMLFLDSNTDTIGQVLLLIVLMVCVVSIILVSYIQTLIVLLLGKLIED